MLAKSWLRFVLANSRYNERRQSYNARVFTFLQLTLRSKNYSRGKPRTAEDSEKRTAQIRGFSRTATASTLYLPYSIEKLSELEQLSNLSSCACFLKNVPNLNSNSNQNENYLVKLLKQLIS